MQYLRVFCESDFNLGQWLIHHIHYCINFGARSSSAGIVFSSHADLLYKVVAASFTPLYSTIHFHHR